MLSARKYAATTLGLLGEPYKNKTKGPVGWPGPFAD
jgi:hypothetical protein